MKLSQHKLTYALLLSGVAHGLFMFGSLDDELFLRSPESQRNALHLEFTSIAAVARSEHREQAVGESNRETLSTQKNLTEKKVFDRNDKNEKSTDAARDDLLVNSGKDRYQQKKQLSKRVENHDALMQLVYQAISEHKRYPYMARRLSQQGKVTLNFVMHPDGQVTDVMVIKSSHYPVLDRAAEQAVVTISPFAMAADYLVYEKVFDIAVDFRLN